MLSARRVVSGLLIVHATVIQSACGPSQPTRRAGTVRDEPPLDGGYSTPRTARDSQLAVLAVNERRWNAVRLERYTAIMRTGCGICPTSRYVLDVDRGVVIPRRDRAGNQILTYNAFAVFSIDSVFRFAEAAIRDSAQEVRIRFDSALGFPREIITQYPYYLDTDQRIRLDSVHRVTPRGTRAAPPT